MEPVEALALVSGRVDEELLLRNEYQAAENEILKSKFSKPLQLNNCERIRSAKTGKRIGQIKCQPRLGGKLKYYYRKAA